MSVVSRSGMYGDTAFSWQDGMGTLRFARSLPPHEKSGSVATGTSLDDCLFQSAMEI